MGIVNSGIWEITVFVEIGHVQCLGPPHPPRLMPQIPRRAPASQRRVRPPTGRGKQS